MRTDISILYDCFRGNHLKALGSIIEAQKKVFPLSRVVIWFAGAESYQKPGTSIDREAIDQLQAKWPDVKFYIGSNFLEVVKVNNINVVVCLAMHLPAELSIINECRKEGVKFCSVGYFGEEFMFVAFDGPGIKALEPWDLVTTFSQHWIDSLCNILANEAEREIVREKVKPIGFTELDQAKDFDKEKIRDKYGIPQDKKVIYFSTYPNFFRWRWIHKFLRLTNQPICDLLNFLLRPYFKNIGVNRLISYRKLMADMNKWACHNDGFIISKTRLKHRDPGFVQKYSDKVFSDGDYYPFRTLELIYASDLYIGFPSCSVIEALFLRKPSMTIYNLTPFGINGPWLFDFKKQIYQDCLWQEEQISSMNCVYEKGGYEEFFNSLDRKSKSAIDEQKYKEMIIKLLGHDDYNASDRFLELVKNLF